MFKVNVEKICKNCRHFDNSVLEMCTWYPNWVSVAPNDHYCGQFSIDEKRLFLAQQVSWLDISVRAVTRLQRAGIKTIKQLIEAPWKDLMEIEGIGKKTWHEIKMSIREVRKRLSDY